MPEVDSNSVRFAEKSSVEGLEKLAKEARNELFPSFLPAPGFLIVPKLLELLPTLPSFQFLTPFLKFYLITPIKHFPQIFIKLNNVMHSLHEPCGTVLEIQKPILFFT